MMVNSCSWFQGCNPHHLNHQHCAEQTIFLSYAVPSAASAQQAWISSLRFHLCVVASSLRDMPISMDKKKGEAGVSPVFEQTVLLRQV